MEKERLLNMIKNREPSIDTIGMILSNNVNFGHPEGALISVKKFDDVSRDIIDYFKAYYGEGLSRDEADYSDVEPDMAATIKTSAFIQKVHERQEPDYRALYNREKSRTEKIIKFCKKILENDLWPIIAADSEDARNLRFKAEGRVRLARQILNKMQELEER